MSIYAYVNKKQNVNSPSSGWSGSAIKASWYGYFYEAMLLNTYQISVGIGKLNWPECQYLRHQRFCDSGWTPSFSSGSPRLAKRRAANSASTAPISSTFSVQDAKTRSTPATQTKQLQFIIVQALLNRVCIGRANAKARRRQTKTGCFARWTSTSSESSWLAVSVTSQGPWLRPAEVKHKVEAS